MMSVKVEATRTEIHETRWSGRLEATQVRDILVRALRDALGAPHSGLRLDLIHVHAIDDTSELPVIDFILVCDEDWYLKQDDASD